MPRHCKRRRKRGSTVHYVSTRAEGDRTWPSDKNVSELVICEPAPSAFAKKHAAGYTPRDRPGRARGTIDL